MSLEERQTGRINGDMFKNPEEVGFAKSDVSSAFEHTGFKLEKTGKEIRDAAVQKKAIYEAKKQEHLEKRDLLQQKIADATGRLPQEPSYSYQNKDIADKYKQYGYKFRSEFGLYDELEVSRTTSSAENEAQSEKDLSVDKKELCKLVDMHNECTREVVDACVDIIHLGVMVDNIRENKKYDLTVNQLKVLNL